MSGWRVLFLAGIVVVNLVFVLAGYDAITARLHDVVTTTYDNPAVHEVLACNTETCPPKDPASQEINASLEEIRSSYQQVFSLL